VLNILFVHYPQATLLSFDQTPSTRSAVQDISKGSERTAVTWSRSNFTDSTTTSASDRSNSGRAKGGANGGGGNLSSSWSRELPCGFVYSTNYVYDSEVPVLGPVTTEMSQVCQAKHEVRNYSLKEYSKDENNGSHTGTDLSFYFFLKFFEYYQSSIFLLTLLFCHILPQ